MEQKRNPNRNQKNNKGMTGMTSSLDTEKSILLRGMIPGKQKEVKIRRKNNNHNNNNKTETKHGGSQYKSVQQSSSFLSAQQYTNCTLRGHTQAEKRGKMCC